MTTAEFVTKCEEIPRDYDSFTGLLIPESSFSQPSLPPKELFQRFHALGIAIGSRNLAYWFYRASVLEAPKSGVEVKAVISSAEASFNDVIARNNVHGYYKFMPCYDIERARRYCDRYALSYNDGPYIIYSAQHPDDITQPDITVRLKGLKYDQYLQLLNSLEQSLLTDRDAAVQLKTRALVSRWQNAISNSKESILRVVQLVARFR